MTTMKKYKSPIIRVKNLKLEPLMQVGSTGDDGSITGGGSNSGIFNPTAESKSRMFSWDEDDEEE